MSFQLGILISTYLENPAGMSGCFSINEGVWERDYNKYSSKEEHFETHEDYLASLTYEVFALWEIKKMKHIPYNHWQFYAN